jgi:hypothetical protein
MISRLVELGRRTGRWAATALGLDHPLRPLLARNVREEQAILDGRMLGLTDIETRELIDAAREYLRWNPPGWPGSEEDYDLIRRWMMARAMYGPSWEPPE